MPEDSEALHAALAERGWTVTHATTPDSIDVEVTRGDVGLTFALPDDAATVDLNDHIEVYATTGGPIPLTDLLLIARYARLRLAEWAARLDDAGVRAP